MEKASQSVYASEQPIYEKELDAFLPGLLALRRRLHEHPEPGTQEIETGKIITECLDQWGIPWKRIADTGILAWLDGAGPAGSDAHVVGLRADIDALPIQEASNHACRSKNPGMMHACGHDAHTAILLGTARLLQLFQNEWAGTIKFFFQPAEETCGGAQRMVQEGCMENPPVDYVAGLHVMPQYHTGQIEVKYGKLNASSDEVMIEIHGRGAHGAYPEQGIDTVVIASQLVLSLQSLVSRAISPLNSAVLTFGAIHGGTACNVICDRITLDGTLRTLDPKTRQMAKDYIRRQAASIAAAYGADAQVIFHSGYDALINDNALTDLVVENAAPLLGKENIFWKEFPSLGVEDFSFFQESARAGVFYHLGCTPPGQTEFHPVHTADFQIDENCIKTGVALQYTLTRRLLRYSGPEGGSSRKETT